MLVAHNQSSASGALAGNSHTELSQTAYEVKIEHHSQHLRLHSTMDSIQSLREDRKMKNHSLGLVKD